jgi:hypothetical protein
LGEEERIHPSTSLSISTCENRRPRFPTRSRCLRPFANHSEELPWQKTSDLLIVFLTDRPLPIRWGSYRRNRRRIEEEIALPKALFWRQPG